MTVEDWPESEGSDLSVDAEDEDRLIEEPMDGDRDPEFVERMAPLDFNAVDEPEVGPDELAAFLEAHLFDMDEDEWLDLCEYSQVLMLYYTHFIYRRLPCCVEEGPQVARTLSHPPSDALLAHDLG